MVIQEIQIKEFRENQEYVSPSVKVIEVTAQKVLCGSGGIDNMFTDPADGGELFN